MRVYWLSLLCPLFAQSIYFSASSTVSAVRQTETRQLFQGDIFESHIHTGQLHRYRVKLDADQLLHLTVAQKGIDVLVTIYQPDGQKVAEVDSPIGARGVEPVLFIAPVTGAYQVTISALEQAAKAGVYEINVLAITPATARDKAFVRAKNLTAEAEATRNKFTADSLRQAIVLYHQAIAVWQEAASPKDEAYATHGLGRAQEALSEYSAAAETYRRALPLWRTAEDRQGEAMTLSNLGLVYYFQSDYPQALECFDKALPLRRAAGDQEGEGFTLVSYASVFNAIGESEQAISYLENALASARELQQKRLTGIALHNLAILYHRQNNLQKALDYQREALAIRQHLPNGNEQAVSLNHFGELHSLLGDHQQAQTLFQAALVAARGSGNQRSEIQILESFGLMNLKKGDFAQAMDYLNQAIQLARKTGSRSVEAIEISCLGDVYAAKQEYPQALDSYQQALQICRALGNRQVEAEVLFKIGRIQGALKQYDEAARQLGVTLELSRALKNNAQEMEILFTLAQVEAAQGRLLPAQTHIETALAMVETVRRGFRMNDFRAAFLASRRELAAFYIDLLMRQTGGTGSANSARALLASEQFRARSLLDLLVEARAEIKAETNSELLTQERGLQQKISDKAQALTAMLGKKLPAERSAPYEKELATLMEQLRESQAQIRAKHPRYAALTQPQPLTLPEIQALLDADTVLLEYMLGKERSYLWVVTPSSLTSYELPKQAEIELKARRVNELFVRSHERSVRAPAQLAAAELSQMILGPAAEQLQGKRLLIVSDGALQYVPFAALPEPEMRGHGDTGTRRNQAIPRVPTSPNLRVGSEPLIVKHEIVSLPSVSVLPLLRQENGTRKKADKAIAIIADPVFQPKDQRVAQTIVPRKSAPTTSNLLAANLTRSASETGMVEFARLPFTRQEADAIYALTAANSSLKALDFQASRATALGAELNQYRILHFATHGLLNSQHPELSGLVLSLVDENGQPQDGFLRLHDIYNLNLGAELVVLSACRTALGKEINGEGLIGLTRGFMYAGAKSVIASLWDVKDEATAELMKRFYQNLLKQGQRPAAALRAAQISVLQENRWAAPYFWAGFTIQGEWN